MAFSVNGKTALITGAGSGICLELTKLLLSKNCNVLLADLRLSSEAQSLVSSHSSTSFNEPTNGGRVGETDHGVIGGKSGKAVFKETDVADWSQLEDAFKFAVEEFGGLDIVVPGAGLFEPDRSSFWHPLTSHTSPKSPSTFATLEINITHPIKAAQLSISTFKRLASAPASSSSSPPKQHGAIILISSIAAQLPLFPYPLYAASKAAISSFVRSLAPLESTMGIRVAAVAPGIVKTPIWSEEKLKMVDESQDEWVPASKIAETILLLIEGEEFVGGSVVEVGVEKLRLVAGTKDDGPLGRGCVVTGDPGVVVEGTFRAIGEEFGK